MYPTARSHTILLLLTITTHLINLASCKCYKPSGEEMSSEFESCTGTDTICCGSNRPNPPGGNRTEGYTADECLPNGLCMNRFVENGTDHLSYWRGFCTTQDWNSKECLSVCTTGGHVSEYGNTPMTPCDPISDPLSNDPLPLRWCCGEKADCCDSNPVFLAPKFGEPITPTGSGSVSNPASSTPVSSSPSSSPTSSNTNTNTPPPTPPPNPGLSTAAKAGIGVGAAVGALLLIGTALFVARSRRERKKRETEFKPVPTKEEEAGGGTGIYAPYRWELHNEDVPRSELGEGRPHELDVPGVMHELEGSGGGGGRVGEGRSGVGGASGGGDGEGR